MRVWKYVSILILLEVPLQQKAQVIDKAMKSCFNPYFTGSTTSTRGVEGESMDSTMFQSLFYWKYHFNEEMEEMMRKEIPGFNPYFTGSTTSTSKN